MKYAQIFAIGTILAMLSLLVGGGCTSLGKVGDGKLEPVTKGAAKAALTAASAAALFGEMAK